MSQFIILQSFTNWVVQFISFSRLPQFATRACFLSSETLKSKKRFQEAALEFIKLTNEVYCFQSRDKLFVFEDGGLYWLMNRIPQNRVEITPHKLWMRIKDLSCSRQFVVREEWGQRKHWLLRIINNINFYYLFIYFFSIYYIHYISK